jgi:hypothetical protein
VGDPIQPRPQAQLTAIGPQAREGAHEHILEDILGVGIGSRQHLAYVRQQPGPVAIVDDPESVVVTAAEEPDELLVRP